MSAEGVLQVSVVVVSHRRKYMQSLAPLLIEQCWRHGSAEVVVVADYDPDPRPAIEHGVIRWVRFRTPSNIAAQRNCGIRTARGRAIAFCDDDCRPHAGWLVQGCRYLDEHPEADGVEGHTTLGPGSPASSNRHEFKRLETRGYRTNNIFYRKAALQKIGGFDERFRFQREDLDCAFTILEQGGRIDVAHRIRMDHLHRPSERWDLLKNCLNRRWDPLLYKKHPRHYRAMLKRPVPPSIALIGGVHGLVLCAGAGKLKSWPMIILVDGLLCLGMALRRNLRGGVVWSNLPALTVSVCIAPICIAGALLYGSWRFKKLFLL